MNDRQKRIYNVIEKNGNASVEQLVREVFASPATIRRDLTKMEADGIITRIWGGAMLSNKAGMDPPAFARAVENVSAKKSIARKALQLISEGSSVFLPSGSTVSELCKILTTFSDLTVITTCIDFVDEIRKSSSIKVFVPAGELYERHDIVGALTKSSIEKFYADYFFFSCSGLTADGFTSNDLNRLEVLETMSTHSAKTVLLCDSSKVGKKCTYFGFELEKIDVVIMDKSPKDKVLIEKLGKKLIVCEQ